MTLSSLRRATQTLLLAAIFGLTCHFAHAQGITTGSISGSVADTTGAVIPGAKVTATAVATQITAQVVSSKDGSFAFKSLPIGKYTVAIAGSGFSGRTLKNIQVAAGRDQGLGVQMLRPGSAQTVVQVNVSAAANLLETTQSQVTTTFNAQQITNLPTMGRLDELALLIPGVADAHDDNFTVYNGTGSYFAPSVNGERSRSNNFEIDGQANNDTVLTGPQAILGNEEAIAEVQVVSNSFSAQYGRDAGSVINYITKSGTNAIHGSAIYKYSGNFTSSLAQGFSKGEPFGFCGPGQTPAANPPCMAPVKPRYVDNYYGGTLGFPLLKDKLFAFGSTYWARESEYGALASGSYGSLFPTPAGLTQIAAALPNNPSVAILQQLNPYALSVGNPHQIGAVTDEAVAGIGAPVPFAEFGRQVPFLSTDQEDLGRIDWQATPKDYLFVRYFYQTSPGGSAGAANGGYTNISDTVHSVGADATHTFSSHWVNQLRYSFQQSTWANQGGGFSNCTITNFSNCPGYVSYLGLPDGNYVSPLGLPSGSPQGYVVKAGQLQDNATWISGHHSISFGGDFIYNNEPITFLPNTQGAFYYDTLDDFLSGGCDYGYCSVSVAQGSPDVLFKEKDYALYAQDDWRVTPSLTLNLGLRWEYFGQPINYLHQESVARQTGPHPFWSTALPLSQTTVPEVANYYKNFEPRLGFAWNPESNRRLVVRGAYSINADPEFLNIAEDVAKSAPMVASGSINCATGTTNCIPTGGATFTTVQQQLAPQLATGGSPGLDTITTVPSNFRNPLGQTYTLGVQYQLRDAAVVEIRYVGNHTSRMFQALDANPYLANVAADFPNVVNPASLCSAANSTLGGADVGFLHCGHTVEEQIANTAFSQYHALQSDLTMRSYHGVTATVAYTWSHTIDNTSEIYSTGANGNTLAYAQNPLNTDRGERGNSGLDFPNTASLSMTYLLPSFHTGKNLLDKLVNGWQTNTLWLYNSGQPYTDYQFYNNESPAANYDDPRTQGSYSDLPFAFAFASGADPARPIVSNPKAPVGTLGIYTDTTLSPGVFSAPQLVDFATGAPVTPSQVHFIANNQLAAIVLNNPYPGSGRNILRGDTFNNVDFSVFKNTKITDRVTFRLEVDAFNVLNRAFFQINGNDAAPDNYVGDYPGGSFNNFSASYASGSSLVTPGSGLRNMLFVGKLLF